ncbi:hypothetical protein [Vibrio fluvialis]|uniref:hypothetical protein n=1 Tax=Vibrio fluvialis TaxID=676 RepID=UPI0037DBBEDB
MSEAARADDDMEVMAGFEEKKGVSGFSTEQLRRDLEIRDADLDGCMTEQASLYGYYSILYARAQLEADHAKIQVEIIKAKKSAALRNAKAGRGLKYTEAQIEAETLRSEDFINATHKANLTRMRATILKEGLEAFKQRRDMLVQKGKARLEDLKGELYLKAKATPDAESRLERIQRIREEAKHD